MEEVMAALRKIQNDLDEQKTTIIKNADEITEKVTRNINKILDQKLKTLEKNQEKYDKKIENQEQRLNQLERQARQRNVVFFGIEENERSYSHLENSLIDFLEKYFSLNINCHDLEAARRIGKKTDKPRPIAVTFATLGSKIKMLQEQVKIEQEKGNKAIIKYDKLVVLKHNKTDADHTDNRKRPRVPLDEADDEEPRADCVTPRGRGGDLYLSFLTRCEPLTPSHLRCT
ncbi:hypothetical protein EVAR_46775_1 [Eumeta japonica]|uniref:Endonuclease-reverse transcriptase n=1 Tax=Eumeta variegata TaxID=151549 RepID=A0A4C1XF85_EUMVA|nr:hypothetical protein EVAR_46775_1 [Eumeta japonica]